MPLAMGGIGETFNIKKIKGKDETRRFLENLGFVEGEQVTVISKMGDNLILVIKSTRIALGMDMAKRIFI